jgi:L-cysteine desulfidase
VAPEPPLTRLDFSAYLEREWRPALGCTEPACIALAAVTAAQRSTGEVLAVELRCDPRMYKNCYAVGIPHSGRRSGILWAVAIGSQLEDPSVGLEVFRQITPAVLEGAARLIAAGRVTVVVEPERTHLHVDCTVRRAGGVGRAVIAREHTRVVRVERDGEAVVAAQDAAADGGPDPRRDLAAASFSELLELSRSLGPNDRERLRRGVELNTAIAHHGLRLFPESFQRRGGETQTYISHLVCGGVYARMSGEDFVVMTLAGSGNKGIVCSVPLSLWGRLLGVPEALIDEALALACLVTSATTWHLGTLSAVCGCSNAAGIGLAAGLVALEGGGPEPISLAVTNMVGNVAGMVCDGAKMGCGLKVMTAVDAAYRAASLALSGIGIPSTDGIVGLDGRSSLANLGRLANAGMVSADAEILAIMTDKLRPE